MTYYIVKYHQTNPPKIIAVTHNKEVAQDICALDSTQKKSRIPGKSWFYGFTENPPHFPSRAGYQTGEALLKALQSE